MMRLAMSQAGSGLLRAIVRRAGIPRDRILLTSWHSTDWQSLTFTGERHELTLRIAGPGSHEAATRLSDGIEDAEIPIPGHVVADIALRGHPKMEDDGSVLIEFEALMVAG